MFIIFKVSMITQVILPLKAVLETPCKFTFYYRQSKIHTLHVAHRTHELACLGESHVSTLFVNRQCFYTVHAVCALFSLENRKHFVHVL